MTLTECTPSGNWGANLVMIIDTEKLKKALREHPEIVNATSPQAAEVVIKDIERIESIAGTID